jgi:hypothetical protein
VGIAVRSGKRPSERASCFFNENTVSEENRAGGISADEKDPRTEINSEMTNAN